MPAAAQELASYLASLTLDDVPADVVDKAKSCIADTVGVALAGALTPWARASAAAALAEGRQDGDAHVLGTDATTSPSLAALANGTAGHALDFDDDNAQVHAGAAVVPTALAVGEAVAASGRDVVGAVVLGYETAVRAGWAFNPDALYARGFHPTGIANAFGCAATAGVLFGLDETRLTSAFGIVGSMAAGLLEFYTAGAMTKRLHGGHPAFCGTMAARLASEGFTGPATVFEGPFGAINAYSDGGSVGELTRDLGGAFHIRSTAQKYYPMNFSTHGAIDLVAQFITCEGLEADDVEAVRVWIRPFIAEAIGGPHTYRPATVLAAQMSMPFAVALALREHRVTLDHLTDRWMHDPEVLTCADKVETFGDAELDTIDGIEKGSVLPTRVEIRASDGRIFRDELLYQRGDPHNPLSPDDLETKFLDCASRVLGLDRSRAALDDLARIDTWAEPSSFMQAIRN